MKHKQCNIKDALWDITDEEHILSFGAISDEIALRTDDYELLVSHMLKAIYSYPATSEVVIDNGITIPILFNAYWNMLAKSWWHDVLRASWVGLAIVVDNTVPPEAYSVLDEFAKIKDMIIKIYIIKEDE